MLATKTQPPTFLDGRFRIRLGKALGLGALGDPVFADPSGWDALMESEGGMIVMCDVRPVLGVEHPFVLRRLVNQGLRYQRRGIGVLLVESVDGLTLDWARYTFYGHGIRLFLMSELRPRITKNV